MHKNIGCMFSIYGYLYVVGRDGYMSLSDGVFWLWDYAVPGPGAFDEPDIIKVSDFNGGLTPTK